MRVDVIGGGEGGSKNNVHWTLSVAMVEFRLSPNAAYTRMEIKQLNLKLLQFWVVYEIRMSLRRMNLRNLMTVLPVTRDIVLDIRL